MTTRVTRVFFVLLAAWLLLAGPALAQQFATREVFRGVSVLVTSDTEGGICFMTSDTFVNNTTFIPKVAHLSATGKLTTTITQQDISSLGPEYRFYSHPQRYYVANSLACTGDGTTWNLVNNSRYTIGSDMFAAILKKAPNMPKELMFNAMQPISLPGRTMYSGGVLTPTAGYGRVETWANLSYDPSGTKLYGYILRVTGYNKAEVLRDGETEKLGDFYYHRVHTKNATWLPTKINASNYWKLYRISLNGEKSVTLEGFTPASEPILGIASNSTSIILQNLNKGEVEYVQLSEAGGAPQIFKGLPPAESQALTESGVHYILTADKKLYRRLPGQTRVEEIPLTFKPVEVIRSDEKVYLPEYISPTEGKIHLLDEQKVLPEFSVGSVVNGASFAPGISPGSIVTIFGKNLSPVKTSVSNNTAPMATTLNGVEVLVNGIPAPLFHVIGRESGDQVTFQLPHEIFLEQVKLQIRTRTSDGEKLSQEVTVPVQKYSPAVFQFNNGQGNFASLTNAQYQIAGYQSIPRIRTGETGIMWVTGLGQTQPSSLITGNAAKAQETIAKPKLTFSGKDAQVVWSGAAEGFVGLYQINFIMPDVPEDAVRQGTISMGGYESSFNYL